MRLIDSHSHVYLEQFADDLPAVLSSAAAQGIAEIIMPAIDSSTHERMFQVEDAHAICRSMIGLHPCSVTHEFEKELSVVQDYLGRRKVLAIGEIGLDFYWDRSYTDQQYEAFRRQIALAAAHHLPVVIHSREAINECIDVVAEFPGITGVFHCFSGDTEQARRITDLGLMLGIGGVVTFKKAGLDKVLAQTGLSHVILETDAPYLAPVPYRGKRNEPSYVRLIAGHIAGILSVDVEEVAKITTENAERLFHSTDI